MMPGDAVLREALLARYSAEGEGWLRAFLSSLGSSHPPASPADATLPEAVMAQVSGGLLEAAGGRRSARRTRPPARLGHSPPLPPARLSHSSPIPPSVAAVSRSTYPGRLGGACAAPAGPSGRAAGSLPLATPLPPGPLPGANGGLGTWQAVLGAMGAHHSSSSQDPPPTPPPSQPVQPSQQTVTAPDMQAPAAAPAVPHMSSDNLCGGDLTPTPPLPGNPSTSAQAPSTNPPPLPSHRERRRRESSDSSSSSGESRRRHRRSGRGRRSRRRVKESKRGRRSRSSRWRSPSSSDGSTGASEESGRVARSKRKRRGPARSPRDSSLVPSAAHLDVVPVPGPSSASAVGFSGASPGSGDGWREMPGAPVATGGQQLMSLISSSVSARHLAGTRCCSPHCLAGRPFLHLLGGTSGGRKTWWSKSRVPECGGLLERHQGPSMATDTHSLRYYYTVISAPGSGLPEYSSVGYVDDREIVNYNSESRKYRPKVKWMEKVDPGYWERNTQIAKGNEAVYRYNVRTAMSRFNQTGGFHILQVMCGCERRDDGGITGYEQYGYDGGEFLSLDTQRWTYIPTMSQAQISTQRWNSPESQMGERHKNYLEIECIDWLQKHVENGREDLERRVQPQVKVSGQKKDDAMMLHCQVYGFHPKPVHVKWMKNEDDVHSYETTHTLPNPDGTYQIRVSAEVIPKEGESYSCYVDHSSLEEPLNIVWEPSNPSVWVTPVVIAVVVILLAVLGTGGFLLYRRKKADYKATSTSDTSSSDASGNAAKA